MKSVIIRDTLIGEGRPKICASIVAGTFEGIIAKAGVIRGLPVDIAEWRVDWFAEAFGESREARLTMEAVKTITRTLGALKEALGGLPLLFTFRTAAEGGERAMPPGDYEELNLMAAESGGVDLVDVELFTTGNRMQAIADAVHMNQVLVVGSSHDFDKTPPQKELVRRMCLMQDQGADIVKAAVMPRSMADVLTLLAATAEMRERHPQTPVAMMSMGALGVVSRLAGESFGSALTFGAAGRASAPGQVGVEELAGVLEVIHNAVS